MKISSFIPKTLLTGSFVLYMIYAFTSKSEPKQEFKEFKSAQDWFDREDKIFEKNNPNYREKQQEQINKFNAEMYKIKKTIK